MMAAAAAAHQARRKYGVPLEMFLAHPLCPGATGGCPRGTGERGICSEQAVAWRSSMFPPRDI